MKKQNFIFHSLLLILVLFIFSCQHNLLPSPKNESATDPNQNNPENFIGLIPENLVATHGLKGKIELSWQGVQNAQRYYIYEASTPYDNFTQIAETTTTSYIINEKPGAAKYYKVTAITRGSDESPFSIIAHGTTLANPVITYISQDDENSDFACTVHWYMNNCNINTYQQNVRFTINCFDPQGNNVAEKIHDGTSDYPSIIFDNLTPNTNYTYQVTAYIVSNQNDTEISDKVDASTARRLRPNAPENISATTGTSTSEITITFDLPTMVDVALGNGIYEQKPLYFKIFRRVATDNATDADWQIIESKFTAQEFSSQYTPSNPEQLYEPGMTVTYTDAKELKRGTMYEYKVQSYADETTREISSNQSFATTQGFLMAVPKFETVNYETIIDTKGTADEADDIYTQVKTNFNFVWNMNGYEKDYAFILSEKRYKLEIDNNGNKDVIGSSETFEYFTTIESVNNFQKAYDLTHENTLNDIRGYYTYKLYIIENPGEDYTVPSAGQTFDYIAEVSAFGTTLVTQDTTSPEINNFSTKDGYKNKICLSWEYDETIAKYTIHYEAEDGTENIIDDFSTLFENANNGDIVTYEHIVESGFSATYTLEALRGISVSTEPVKLYTLGTPKLTFDEDNPQYDTISVNWNPVNKVDTYELSYSVDGKNYTEPVQIPVSKINVDNPKNFIVNSDGSYTYNFFQPSKYDDATFSGKNVLVKIQAKNSIDSTTNSTITKTLGPALTKKSATVALSTESIFVRWNKVQGAKKYLIKRERYSIDNKSILSTDFYYINTDASNISVEGEDIDTSKYIKVSYDENALEYKLQDLSYPNLGKTKWQINQDRINWGFPYHYTIFPLENETDSFDAETGTLAERVIYKNLSSIESIGSALGYGHNVTATKSEDPKKVTITWEKPYISDKGSYDPVLWRSESGKNKWEKAGVSLDSSGDKFVFIPKYNSITKVNERITPYDYAVMYEDTSSKPNQTYLDDLATKVDENNEPFNKGYAFAIETSAENVTVDGEAGYNEKISWKLWNYEKRAKGPKQDAIYIVQMKNNNLGADWKTVATYTNDGTISINSAPEYDATITQRGNGIVIAPNGLEENNSAVHNGLLKVLRDYKHYAKVIVTRETANGEITASFADDEENNYIVRKITEGELCNNVALIVADALYKTGIPYKTVMGSKTKSTSGTKGTFSITGSPVSAVDYKNKITWGFGNEEYKHEFSNGISSANKEPITSAFTLKAGNASSSEYASDDNKLYHLPALDITVSHETNEPSYQGKVTISIGEVGKSTTYSLTYKKDDTTIRTLSKDTASNFYKYFPYDLGTDHTDPDKTLNKNFIIYQSPWWN